MSELLDTWNCYSVIVEQTHTIEKIRASLISLVEHYEQTANSIRPIKYGENGEKRVSISLILIKIKTIYSLGRILTRWNNFYRNWNYDMNRKHVEWSILLKNKTTNTVWGRKFFWSTLWKARHDYYELAKKKAIKAARRRIRLINLEVKPKDNFEVAQVVEWLLQDNEIRQRFIRLDFNKGVVLNPEETCRSAEFIYNNKKVWQEFMF